MYKFLLLLLCPCVYSAIIGTVNVMTAFGTIMGYENEEYKTFFGIPYALVDIENPFGPSLRHPSFVRPFDAKDPTIFCPQAVFQQSNDLQCLNLNIYVPLTANSTYRVPVLIWFHGGGHAFGSAGEYGGEHLVKQDIVVVVANYRLGPYGFLCLDVPEVPGNQGLKDQADAMKWVFQNIGAFGGNPDKITIAGESYGGGAVDLHLYSDYVPYFDKVIIQSGSIFDEGFYVRPDHDAAIKIAHHLGFRAGDTRAALKFLNTAQPVLVTAAALNMSLSLGVCKEKRFPGEMQFVTKDPFHIENPERIRTTKIMIGYTSMELLYLYANQTAHYFHELGDVFFKGIEKNFILSLSEVSSLSNILKSFYLGTKKIGPESVLELSQASSDFVVNHAVERSINKYLKVGTTIYKYLFSYVGGSKYKKIKGAGAPHTEELKYLFEWDDPISGGEQRWMRKIMTNLWANFVKFGNPTPKQTEVLPVKWEPMSPTHRNYLNINVKKMAMRNHVFKERMAFWDLFWHNYEKYAVIYTP